MIRYTPTTPDDLPQRAMRKDRRGKYVLYTVAARTIRAERTEIKSLRAEIAVISAHPRI